MDLTATRVAALTISRTRRARVRTMLTAVILPISGYASSLFDFAVAAAVSAILIGHCYHLLPVVPFID